MIRGELIFTIAYTALFLGGARLLSKMTLSEAPSFWTAFVATTLLAAFYCRSVHNLWLVPSVYLAMFSLDFIFEWHWITTLQTESIATAIPATLIFILPLVIGFGTQRLARRAYAN